MNENRKHTRMRLQSFTFQFFWCTMRACSIKTFSNRYVMHTIKQFIYVVRKFHARLNFCDGLRFYWLNRTTNNIKRDCLCISFCSSFPFPIWWIIRYIVIAHIMDFNSIRCGEVTKSNKICCIRFAYLLIIRWCARERERVLRCNNNNISNNIPDNSQQ